MPVAVAKASPVPVHWVDKVKADLERDMTLGVIERVPVNTYVTWFLILIEMGLYCPKVPMF